MPFVSQAQRVTIRGVVRDAIDREALPRVSVRLLTAKDSTYVTGTTGDNNGNFTLQPVAQGRYIAQFSFLGYQTQCVNPEKCRRVSCQTSSRRVDFAICHAL